jgi:hypothetical protein
VFRIRPNGDTSLNVREMSDVYSFGGIMYQVCRDPELSSVFFDSSRQVLCAETPFASAASRATSEYCLPSNMANAPNNRG